MTLLFQDLNLIETSSHKRGAEIPGLVQVLNGIILIRGSTVLKFRAGTLSKAILARARDKWGPGTITDHEGYEVTEESPALATAQYEYETSTASKPSALK